MVLRSRAELKLNLRTVVLFPFYRTFCLLFRVYALIRNVLMYATWRRKALKISTREEEIQDMPPVCLAASVKLLGLSILVPRVCCVSQVPPVADPDWWTIWVPNAKDAKEDAAVSSRDGEY